MDAPQHRRRPRYAGKYPRRFEDRYKELSAADPDTVAKVIASGKTPAGTHRPIMVPEILACLDPKPGEIAVDCTLGYGGHAERLLERIHPGGRLIGLDADTLELPKTEARLRALGLGEDQFITRRTNFAAIRKVLADLGVDGVNLILADLGVSSMQLDNPARGFSVKAPGPLDMRMNPQKGEPASAWLKRATVPGLTEVLKENADEPRAEQLAEVLAGKLFSTTTELSAAVKGALPRLGRDELESTVRRVFQALRIEVNDELSVLDMLLREAPGSLLPGGRIAILTFHSGEDGRVKKAFARGLAEGVYDSISPEPIRPSAEEKRANPRSSPAKLRWARRANAR